MAACNDNLADLWQNQKKYSDLLGEKTGKLVLESIDQYSPEDEIQKLKNHDVGYITIFDREYPELLREIPDCPAVLYIRGNAESLKLPSISIVGSRKFTHYGKTICYDLAKKLSEAGLVVISGLALGIDSIAHQAAVDSGLQTIGILGCGLDKVYPETNYKLAEKIIENGGAIMSEYPIGTLPFKAHFPARNRIIAGLSRGTLVVEAAVKSGALITAYLALDYNREVFAVPGNIDSEESKGTNQLLKEGAKIVTSFEDIVNELNIPVMKIQQRIKNEIPLSNEEKKILEILRYNMMADDIVIKSSLDIIVVNASLTMLEMKGMVENIGGGFYKKIDN